MESYLVHLYPAKVVNFIWRAALNILPSRSLFGTRLSNIDVICLLCGMLKTRFIFAETVWQVGRYERGLVFCGYVESMGSVSSNGEWGF